jgi:predicted small secreted protein
MKKSILTFAFIALALSFTSCKETTVEKTEDVEYLGTEAPAKVIETPAEVTVDTVSKVEENINETPAE